MSVKSDDRKNRQYSFSINGKRFRGSTHTTNKKLADQYETKIKNEAYSQLKLGKRAGITLEQALAKYWTEHAKDQSWSLSVWGYMKSYVAAWGKDTYMSEINDAKFSELISFLKKKPLANHKKNKKTGLAPSSINRHAEAFRKLHRLCKDTWGYEVAKINFAAHRLTQPDSRIRYITTEQAISLIGHADEHLKPIIRFALYTGVRKTNIFGLKWRDVDMVSRQINFKVKSHLPGGKNHTVHMASGLYKMLKRLQPKPVNYNQNVFLYKGEPLRDNVKKALRSACKKAGIKDFRFHDLRHTCASWLVQDGTPIEVVKDILGHTDIKTTLKYAHHHDERKLEAMENTFKGRVGI